MLGGRPAENSRPWGRAQRMLGVQQWLADVGGQPLYLLLLLASSRSFIPGFKPPFSASSSRSSLPFLLQDRLHGFPGLFTDTSGHIRFLLFSFSVFPLLAVGSVR